jgi:hypothetical protein
VGSTIGGAGFVGGSIGSVGSLLQLIMEVGAMRLGKESRLG